MADTGFTVFTFFLGACVGAFLAYQVGRGEARVECCKAKHGVYLDNACRKSGEVMP